MCVVSARLTGVSLSVGRNPSSHLSWLCFSGFSDWFVLHILPSRFGTIWKNHISRSYVLATAFLISGKCGTSLKNYIIFLFWLYNSFLKKDKIGQKKTRSAFEPLPVKRTVKKYKIFPASRINCWPLFMQQEKAGAFLRVSSPLNCVALVWCCNSGCNAQSSGRDLACW